MPFEELALPGLPTAMGREDQKVIQRLTLERTASSLRSPIKRLSNWRYCSAPPDAACR